jgi:DNA-binding NtrC family response regulator
MSPPGKHVLLVDDDPRVLEMLGEYFATEYSAYAVLTANNGADGVELARAHRPALILLDIEMPVMNGVAALREIKKVAKGIPVVMVTGQDDVKVLAETLKGEAFSYLPKPVNFAYLNHIVGSVLGAPSPRRK